MQKMWPTVLLWLYFSFSDFARTWFKENESVWSVLQEYNKVKLVYSFISLVQNKLQF